MHYCSWSMGEENVKTGDMTTKHGITGERERRVEREGRRERGREIEEGK